MRIGLLGTRGIPNRYGGFEEFAEQVSILWAKKGNEVFVYCEDGDNRTILNYPGVYQVFIKPSKIPFFGQMIYDYRSTKHALGLDLDIYYHAGYATSVLGNCILMLNRRFNLIYNMDGLEWKRTKFNRFTRILTKRLEKMAVLSGAELVSDNMGIKDYILSEYGVNSTLIEYGAEIFNSSVTKYTKYPETFDLVIARFEPENHIEEILSTYESSGNTLVLVANTGTKHFKKLERRILQSRNIIFNGPVYDKEELAFLKEKCRYYIHGHSVGGTNPSLIEALAAGCMILVHSNEFNLDVVQGHAHSWHSKRDLQHLVDSQLIRRTSKQDQVDYCTERFNWNKIADLHLDLFEKIVFPRKVENN